MAENLYSKIFSYAARMLVRRKIDKEYFGKPKLHTKSPPEFKLDFQTVDVKIGIAKVFEETLIFIPSFEDDVIQKVKNETVQALYAALAETKLTHAILIYDQIAPAAKSSLIEHSIIDSMEIFHYKKMLFDPTEHVYTPYHYLLSDEEIKIELKGENPKNLPHILKTDPIVLYYGWKPGSIVRINRLKGPPYYRLIV